MKKGREICLLLRRPDEEERAATEWLTLYVLADQSITEEKFDKKLRELWKKIHTCNPKFYLIFPSAHDTHKNVDITNAQMLMRLEEIGLARVSGWSEENAPYWAITEKGEKLLIEIWPKIKHILHGSIKWKMKRKNIDI